MMNSRLFCSLTTHERSVVSEAMLIAVVHPGAVCDIDRRELRRRLLALPWAWEPSFADEPPGPKPTCQLSYVENGEVLERIAGVVSRSLVREDHRERVYALIVVLSFADGGGAEDVDKLDSVRKAFSIDRVRAAEIVEDLKLELQDIVR